MFFNDDNWTLNYKKFIPEEEKKIETLCTVGNGFMGTRGAFEESVSSDHHYPGTFMPGLYNTIPSQVGDRTIENEDFVNCPNWTSITFKIDNKDWIDLSKVEILEYRKQLNFKYGKLIRKLRIKDSDGKITTIQSMRFASMEERHIACIRYTITPENYSGKISVRSALDGAINNEGVNRYKQLNSLHLAPLCEGSDEKGIYLSVITNQSHILIEMAARNSFILDGNALEKQSTFDQRERYISEECSFELKQRQNLTLDKVVSVVTSRDCDISYPSHAVKEILSKAEGVDELHAPHCTAWDNLWKKADIEIEGADDVQKILRLHAYHLLVTASKNNVDIDASIPPRGLHGEAYRGHIFWDELYILPFYFLHFPEVARACLLYRYRRLDEARKYAAEHGFKGAMYPWQTGSIGREETQVIHLNPKSGEWGPDFSALQRHVSLAIAYNTWMYFQISQDHDFLAHYGAEMLLEICRFWASKTQLNEKTGKFEIHGVMGPNEYHEMAPGSKEGGLKDNAYTNIMTVWLMKKCLNLPQFLSKEELSSVRKKMDLSDKEMIHWNEIERKMNIAVTDDIISQYDGFLDLEELDWDGYQKKYGDIGRMDRILKAEDKSPDDYQLSKQADWLMTFYVLPFEEIVGILKDLGHPFNYDILRKNYDYYLPRTSHGSTLSLIVHARVADLLNDDTRSLEWFSKALTADVSDIQGGTVKEGIHTGLMAGTIYVFLSSFAGLDFLSKTISFNPSLPDRWKKVSFNFTHRSNDFFVILTHEKITIRAENADGAEVMIKVKNEDYALLSGKEEEISY